MRARFTAMVDALGTTVSGEWIPNWVAGPSNLVAFTVLFALRVRAEEKMMADEFGDAYTAYTARTKRLVPGVW